MAKNEKVSPVVVETPAAPAKVSLRNRTRGQLVFNLPHAEYCGDGECSCSVVSRRIEEYDFRTGEHVPKVVDHRICGSVGFLSGETVECDLRVLRVGAIDLSIQRGDLVNT